jgi:NADH dehydrogenase FAD-containing subunit
MRSVRGQDYKDNALIAYECKVWTAGTQGTVYLGVYHRTCRLEKEKGQTIVMSSQNATTLVAVFCEDDRIICLFRGVCTYI